MPSDKRFARLDQLVSGLGYGSRKYVDIALKRGRITVDGLETPKSEMRVDPELVKVDGQALDHPHGLLILLNKPTGYVCTHAENEGITVYELLSARWNLRSPKLESVGRLDKETSGLLLITDQHELVHRLTSPKSHVAKVYEATVENPLTPEMVAAFEAGLMLRGETKPCLPAKLEILGPKLARVTIREGRYHQVRRMFGAAGSPVVTLKRLSFGALNLDGLKEGEFRTLTPSLAVVEGT